MSVLIMAGQLLLALSILVGLHEMGHLLAAKMFGMRVEKFSIGFPPKIWGFTYGETEYSIGAVPLGGFVKITGMIDESLDTARLKEEPEPYEFRAKPAWQRLIVMLGGIIVNVITGIFIFVTVMFVYGETYISKEELNKDGIWARSLGEEIGFETGDKVISINGKDYDRYSQIKSTDVILGDAGYYLVDRNGQEVRIDLPKDFLDRYSDKKDDYLFYRFRFKVGPIKSEEAKEAGLEVKDKILSVNGQSFTFFDEFRKILDQYKATTINLEVQKEDGSIKTLTVPVDKTGAIGFAPVSTIEKSHQDFTLGESIKLGTAKAFNVVWINILAFKKMIKGDINPSKSLSGPIGIAEVFGDTFSWEKFWSITGLLSMVLAFMNLLPIPALDGGHVVFLLYEMISGRKPSEKFLENAQKVGMILLLALMVFAFGNDIYKLIVKAMNG